jgi:membrane-associated phospholipid phosphatase
MKILFSIMSWMVIAACVSAASAQSGTSKPVPAQASTVQMWNRIALEAVERARLTQHQAMRLMAYVSLAQYAVLSTAENEQRARDAVATASMQIIAGLVPSQAALAGEYHSRLVPHGTDDGTVVAQRVLSQANNDGFAQAWNGPLPQTPYTWRSLVNPPAAPAYPAVGAMRTFLVASGSVFRPAPPPAQDSLRFREDLSEVLRHTASPTAEWTRLAKFYDMTTSTLVAGFWNGQATTLIGRNNLGDLQATRILATMNAAVVDAVVACHDAKYAYWVPRPSQADPSIKPLIGVPNHPSYPSNHSCISTAAALTLAHFFPQDQGRLAAMATEAGLSRIYAGLHYRFDVEAGEDIGRKVASVAVAGHEDMLARWTRTQVAEY